MKIEELMIGDIVEYLDGDQPIPVVVVKIDGPSSVVCLKQKNGHKFNTTIEYLSPIPLTPEILEKNNFKMLAGVYYLQTEERKPIQIVFKDNNIITLSINCDPVSIKLKYVHKLQHAISLYEINKQITLP